MTIPCAVAFCLLRPLHLIAPIPYSAIVALLLSASLINTFVVASLPDVEGGWRLTVRTGVYTAVIAAVIYGIGWGPLLAVGFVFGAADAMRAGGSRAARAAIIFTVLWIGVGQIAIYVGSAPTLVRQPLVQGLGLLGALGAVMTIKVLQWFAAARESGEGRFRVLVQNASDVVAVVDAHRCFSWVSPSFERTLGWSVSDFESRPAADLLHPDDLQMLSIQTAGRGIPVRDVGLRREIRLRHADGSWRWFDATVTNHLDDPDVKGIVANLHDVTERRTLEQELRHQAFHDSLTGLANRALFADRLEHALSRHGRTAGTLAVLIVDLDDFKAVNDSLGHGVGDRLLDEAAQRLLSIVRSSDTVERLGGDEFALLLEDPTGDQVPAQVAARIVETFREPILLGGQALALSASVGVAFSVPEITSVDELIRDADVAMYAAKAEGKNRFVIFEPGMHVAIQKRLELKNGLQEAVTSGNQMELYYQPLVDLRTREVVGLEALLRWNHPRLGLVSPLEFLPLAEESGLIVPLGRWILNQAASQMARWQQSHVGDESLTMSVNVSGRQLDEPDFVEDVRLALADTGLDPASLVLEITESVLMRDTDTVVRRLHELKSLGVGLAIDDFGTGYSSLGYLKSFPVDILKVDRSFVSDISCKSRDASLAETVVRMGATLDLRTVAEGVELEAQADQLEALGCNVGQGFLFAKPLPASACEDFLRTCAATPVTEA